MRPAAELDATNTLRKRFVYASGRNVPDFFLQDGTPFLLVSDPRGSVRLVVNAATGGIEQELGYDAWGMVTKDTAPGRQPFGYAGGVYEAGTGLVHFGAREYDAGARRWLQKDPIGFAGGDSNLYAYVQNDPVNKFDTNGLVPGLLFPTTPFEKLFSDPVSWMIETWHQGEKILDPERLRASAQSAMASRYPQSSWYNGSGDAFRHCSASCMFSVKYDPLTSLMLGTSHEVANLVFDQSSNPIQEREMDDYNNSCGVELSILYSPKNHTECFDLCARENERGRLMTLNPPNMTPWNSKP